MSITLTLDDDVLAKVKAESEARGTSVEGAINELLRTALATRNPGVEPKRFEIKPFDMGWNPELNYDCTQTLLDQIEGPQPR